MKPLKQKTKIALTLLFLSPIIAELSTGSAPPTEFFNPLIFLVMVLLYGCGSLLIREMRVVWGLQWSVVFLAVAFGVIEEGIMTQAFFNVNWPDVGQFAAGYQVLGLILPWSILLTTFHAAVSTLLPILIIDLVWPEYKNKKLFSKKSFWLVFLGFFLVVVFGRLFFEFAAREFYKPNISHLLGCLIFVSIFIFLAYKLRNSRIKTVSKIFSPNLFLALTITFSFLYALAPYIMVSLGVQMIPLVLFQSVVILLLAIFVYYQVFNDNVSREHKIALAYGSMIFWIIFGFLTAIDGLYEMYFVSVAYLFLAVNWKKKMRREYYLKRVNQ